MGDGDVVVGVDGAAGAVDDAGGHGEGAGGGDAGAGEVNGGQGVEVGGDGCGLAVGEEQADGAGQVPRQDVDTVGLGFFGRCTQGARCELGLAEEDSWWWGPLVFLSISLLSFVFPSFPPRK